jgi:hypothetical protein
VAVEVLIGEQAELWNQDTVEPVAEETETLMVEELQELEL